MRFRKYLFTILTLLALGWIAFGCSAANQGTSNLLQSQRGQASTNYQAGVIIGGGISGTIVLCTGVPLFFLFALLAWRNSAGLTNKKRHEETIAVLQQKQKE